MRHEKNETDLSKATDAVNAVLRCTRGLGLLTRNHKRFGVKSKAKNAAAPSEVVQTKRQTLRKKVKRNRRKIDECGNR